MNNIYTEINDILDYHIDEQFEISELADAPILSIIEEDGKVSTYSETLSEQDQLFILKQYKFDELLPSIDGVDVSLIGYVVGREFFVFSVFQRGEEYEQSPERRAAFMEFFNANLVGVKLRHVPVLPQVLKLDGAKRALNNRSRKEDVAHYTTKAIVELASGISPMTKKQRKGLVFKSLTTQYKFMCYSQNAMMQFGSL